MDVTMMRGSAWTAKQVAAIAGAPLPATPTISASTLVRPTPGLDLWDFWPVQRPGGSIAEIAGGAVWMALSAPATGDPVARHGKARIRAYHVVAGSWRDLGNVLPDDISPGSREWSGSAILDGALLTLYFTAAGRHGETPLTFEQRLFETHGVMGSHATLPQWSMPREIAAPTDSAYVRANEVSGEIGSIKAFRDPGYFRDPATGAEYLLFAASLAVSASAYNGATGIAVRDGDGWAFLPPLVHADGLNNELERPHVLVHGGRYYLFWSTQYSVFAPDGPKGPTGLYGMVAPSLFGPYEPLNGTGLVLCNPPEFPAQAFSWLVLDTLDVVSFIDLCAIGPGETPTGDAARAAFGGALAPSLRIALDGATTRLLRAP